MAKSYETGVMIMHPLRVMLKQCLSIWRTWRYAKKNGINSRSWYGVYEAGSEVCVAFCGSLPGSAERSTLIATALNRDTETKPN